MRMGKVGGVATLSRIKYALAVLTALVLAGIGGALMHVNSTSLASASQYCGRGVPLSKCNPTQTTVNPDAKNVPLPKPFWPSPPTVTCGPNFFSEQQSAELTSDFGSISCFRFSTGRQWIVLGDGMSTTAIPTAPSSQGPLLAIETCTNNDPSCLDPETPHSWADFTEITLPDPSFWPLQLMATFGGRLLYLSDGTRVGPVVFDLQSLHWYDGRMAIIDQIMSGSSTPPPIR
jgi:hypothetical protein